MNEKEIMQRNLVEESQLFVKNGRRYGSSFIRALAELAERSDLNNLRKIRNTWKSEWSTYLHWKEYQ